MASKRPGLKIGSLFSGIGGFELGLEWAGLGKTVYQVEQDPFCNKILESHWPGVRRYQDVTTLNPQDLPSADLIAGGFPCQDISVAAVNTSRDGLQGSRSGLWSFMARIIEAQKPTWVVVENVAHGSRRWLPGIRAELARQGYSTLPIQLEARWFGLPHIRRRIFVVAHAYGFSIRQQQQRVSSRRPGSIQAKGQTISVEFGQDSGGRPEPSFLRVDDGIPRELDNPRFKALGNAVVPQCSETVGMVIRELIDAGARPRR